MKKQALIKIVHTKYVFLRPLHFFPRSKQPGQARRAFWLCLCTGCSRFTDASTTALKKGQAISCEACREQAKKAQIAAWERDILDDALNNTVKKTHTRSSYDCMIGRGKHNFRYDGKVCDRWKGEDGYENFVEDMGLKSRPWHTLDRIDPSGSYTKDNCRWADRQTQDRNKTNSRIFDVQGEKMNHVDFAHLLNIKPCLLSRKLNGLLKDDFTEQMAVEHLLSESHSVRQRDT